jgi:hypothetical protein
VKASAPPSSSSSTYTATLHPPYNILANMMYDAIYCFLMIYCISMLMFE